MTTQSNNGGDPVFGLDGRQVHDAQPSGGASRSQREAPRIRAMPAILHTRLTSTAHFRISTAGDQAPAARPSIGDTSSRAWQTRSQTACRSGRKDQRSAMRRSSPQFDPTFSRAGRRDRRRVYGRSLWRQPHGPSLPICGPGSMIRATIRAPQAVRPAILRPIPIFSTGSPAVD